MTDLSLLVVTDLDGTLLDHARYDFAPARPMLDWLAARGVPVVPASSKTAAELALWRRRLGLERWPAVVENGAGMSGAGFDDGAYRRLRAALAALGAPFRGFGDMGDAEVAALTGLAPDEAALARRREHSEPGLWQGPPEGLGAFLSALSGQGISARQGGRFLTLSYGADKVARLAELQAMFRPALTVALGDAPNDRAMLAAADRAVVVANPHGPGLAPFDDETRVWRSRATGPAGWAEGLAGVLRAEGLMREGDGIG